MSRHEARDSRRRGDDVRERCGSTPCGTYRQGTATTESILATMNLTQALLMEREDPGRHRVILIRSDSFGEGDPALGRRLMEAYFRSLHELVDLSGAIILYNEGVKILAPDHPARRQLLSLIRPGLDVLGCRRSLEHYGIDVEDADGVRPVAMMTMVERIHEADQVITI